MELKKGFMFVLFVLLFISSLLVLISLYIRYFVM